MHLSLPRHKYLGREEITWPRQEFNFNTALVTGGKGSIGGSLCRLLEDEYGTEVYCLDLDNGDVCNERNVKDVFSQFNPEIVFHLAAHKYATKAEDCVLPTVQTNIVGTDNILRACKRSRTLACIVASTCKAIAPETVYGASKLIAERSTLNAGYTVARLYNTIDTDGNVFEIWERSAQDYGLIKAASCMRYFMTTHEALNLLIASARFGTGRFAIDPGPPVFIPNIAINWIKDYYEFYHKHIDVEHMELRRGDRLNEPLLGINETRHPTLVKRIMRITNSHDEYTLSQ